MKPVKQLLHWTTVHPQGLSETTSKELISISFSQLDNEMTSRIFHLPSAWWNRRQLDWACFWIFTDRLIPCLCQKSALPCLRLPTLMRAGAKNKKASKGPSWNGLLAIPKDVIPSELRPICSWSTSCSWSSLRKWVARLYELQRVLCQEPTKDHVKKSTAFKWKCDSKTNFSLVTKSSLCYHYHPLS